jgi:hypothetical protein
MDSNKQTEVLYPDLLPKFEAAIENMKRIKRESYGDTERTNTVEDAFVAVLREMAELVVEMRSLRLFVESKGNPG